MKSQLKLATKRSAKRKWPRKKPSQKLMKAADFYHARLDEIQSREPVQTELPWYLKT